jgi:hypothetical protein
MGSAGCSGRVGRVPCVPRGYSEREGTDVQREERQEQQPPVPYYPRYDPSIRVVTLFFAAVLGFGLKNLLDTPNAKNPVEIHTYKGWTWEIYTYKWLFFLVATFIFLRFLTGSANHLWLEYQKYMRHHQARDDVLVIVGFFWLTLFGCLGAFLCYADTAPHFFRRAGYLLLATLAGSMTQWLGYKLKLTSPIGRWGDWWSMLATL